MAKKKYYRTTNIDKLNANYNILLGQRSNGKSYAVKEKVLMKAYPKNKKFVYLRRYEIDVKTSDVESYFGDMPIESITDGEYNFISAYRGNIYFATLDEDNNITRGPAIGRYVYLSGYHHFKSQTFPDTEDIIVEEFVTDGIYIDNEPEVLQNFVSTIARDNPNVKVWMIGNTISRVCPYFEEWCLDKIPRQKPGTIDTYTFERYDEPSEQIVKTLIAVEYCESTGSISSLFFGKSAEHITAGQWQTKDMPKLPSKKDDYTMTYELLFEDNGFRIVMQLMVNPKNGGQFIYVYPYTYPRTIKRKITNRFSTDPFETNSFNPKIPAEVKMKELMDLGKICYMDNLTGSDFENVLMNRKGVL